MTLRERLQKAWDNRHGIAEGFYNEYISMDPEIKAETERRREICKGCEYYDPEGKAEIIVVKGQPGCLLCGCNRDMLTACMSCSCSTPKIGLQPRWAAVSTPEMEKEKSEIAYKKQFDKPQQ